MNKKVLIIVALVLFLTGCGDANYVCLNGYTLNKEKKLCYRELQEQATPNYYCTQPNESLEGQKCKKTDLVPATISRVCNPGYYPEGGICLKDGTIFNYNKCGVDKTYDSKTGKCYDKVNVISLYKCNEGELDGTTCVTISYSDALLEYICPNGYELSGTTCYRTITMDAVNEND